MFALLVSCRIESLDLSDSIKNDKFLHFIRRAKPSQILWVKHVSKCDRLPFTFTALARARALTLSGRLTWGFKTSCLTSVSNLILVLHVEVQRHIFLRKVYVEVWYCKLLICLIIIFSIQLLHRFFYFIFRNSGQRVRTMKSMSNCCTTLFAN